MEAKSFDMKKEHRLSIYNIEDKEEVTAIKSKLHQNKHLEQSVKLPKTGLEKELIKISKNDRGIETVDARDLWRYIESKQEFSNWIRTRIREYGFEKDNDYIVFDEIIKNSNGGRPQVKYCISIDTAKQLAMVERNEKGRKIRQWFIDRENKLREKEMTVSSPPVLPNFNDPVAAARAWADAKEAELKAKQNLLEAKPKIEFYDKVGDCEGLHTVAEAAKILGTGRNRLFRYLRYYKFLRKNNEPYQRFIEAGYFEVRENPYNDQVNTQTCITPSGLQYLQKFRDKNFFEVTKWMEENDIKLTVI